MYIVYSKENCTQCEKVINLLKVKNTNYKVLKLGVDFTLIELLDKVESKNKPKPRSFPVIFSYDSGFDYYIGGLDEIEKLLK